MTLSLRQKPNALFVFARIRQHQERDRDETLARWDGKVETVRARSARERRRLSSSSVAQGENENSVRDCVSDSCRQAVEARGRCGRVTTRRSGGRVTLRVRQVPGARQHRGRGDQAPRARSQFPGSRPLDPTTLDGKRAEVAAPAGGSRQAAE